MQKSADYGYNARKEYNIKPYQLDSIYERLQSIFDDIVIIGGRAVNIYCSNNKRSTHDIDVVVGFGNPKNGSDAIKEKALQSGFMYEESGGLVRKLVDKETDISIDLYYSKPISNIELFDIIKYSQKRTMGSQGAIVNVVHPALLILMKMQSNRQKDRNDVYNLIDNLYGQPELFMQKENKILSMYLEPVELKKLEAALMLIYGERHLRN